MINRLKKDFENSEYNISLILNKSVPYDNRRFRPDVLIKLKTHNIIIENDENQHSGYPKDCEEARTGNIFIGLGCKKLVFIRFNPDSYKDNIGDKHKSCFHDRTCKIKPKDYLKRYEKLTSTLKKHIKHEPSESYEMVNLFYNGYRI